MQERVLSSVRARLYELVTALSMTVGRGAAARLACDLAGIRETDRIVDLGCGPGAAVREAGRRGGQATRRRPMPADAPSRTLDHRAAPSPQRRPGAGGRESIAAAQRERLGRLALSSPHDWDDLTKGLAEAGRTLAPAGVCSSSSALCHPAPAATQPTA
jgi:SAM-dependent methyltransferase